MVMKMKCELCEKNGARMLCESDGARLCWECDEKVHSANFLVAKHSRTLLCHSCNSPTPWTASGPNLCPTVSVCTACLRHGQIATPDDRSEISIVGTETTDDHDSSDDDDDDAGDENQVVPWSSTSSSPPQPQPQPAGSSSASGSGGLTRKRLRNDEYEVTSASYC